MVEGEVMNLNKVIYKDCLNEEDGLPSLPDNSFDLGYTDPPWGVGIGKTLKRGRKYVNGRELKKKKEKIYYEDDFKEEWRLKWFKELERVCKAMVLIISEKHKYWWIRNTEPKGDLTIGWVNGHARGRIAEWSKKSTYLIYGSLPNKLKNDIIPNQTMKWGFLSNWKGKHPSPKMGLNDLKFSIHFDILNQIQPETLIDPFAGSGAFLYVAQMLGIKWLGYEIDKTYSQDISKRLAQKGLEGYL